MSSSQVWSLLWFALLVSCQNIASDPGVVGPPIELVHAYYDEFPTGIAVSANGRKFTNYPPTLDPTNTRYNVAELTSFDTETPYPSVEINSPPGGSINYTSGTPVGANYQNYFIGVQSVVIDPKDRLWVLDSGLSTTPNGTSVSSSYGGPKLIGIDLTNNSIFTTIVFSTSVVYPDSNLNDVRFDLRSSLSASGLGIAYITDSSTAGRNALITVDLGAKTAWRHLDNAPQVRAAPQTTFYIWGEAVYSLAGTRLIFSSSGSDGITLSADGEMLYWTAVGGTYLHGIPTARLRDNGATSEIRAQGSVVSVAMVGTSDGLETDSNGRVYTGHFEQNAINVFDPGTGVTSVFLRDPRIGWTDSMAVAADGYLYFTENQLWRTPSHYPGTDRRVKPYALFRTRLPGDGTKVQLI